MKNPLYLKRKTKNNIIYYLSFVKYKRRPAVAGL
jgi:hypothetical protein